MSETPKPHSDTPHGGTRRVEVVADQATDGSYEIRLESTQPIPAMPTATTRLTAVESAPSSRPHRRRVVVAAAASVAAVVGVGVAVASLGDSAPAPAPTVERPEPSEPFRGFVIQSPTQRTLSPRVLRIDAGSSGPEPDAEAAALVAPDPAPAERTQVIERGAFVPPEPGQIEPFRAERLRAVPVEAELFLAEPATNEEGEIDEYAAAYEDEYEEEYNGYEDDDQDDDGAQGYDPYE